MEKFKYVVKDIVCVDFFKKLILKDFKFFF